MIERGALRAWVPIVAALTVAATLAISCDQQPYEATINPPPSASTPAPRVLPTEAPTVQALSPAVLMVIANTGGEGVRARDACRDEASIPGIGIAEATRVAATAQGVGSCGGWRLVSANGRESWVRLQYLQVAPNPTPTITATAAATAVPTPSSFPTQATAVGPTRCADGMYSHSSGRGTCSHHGGIAR